MKEPGEGLQRQCLGGNVGTTSERGAKEGGAFSSLFLNVAWSLPKFPEFGGKNHRPLRALSCNSLLWSRVTGMTSVLSLHA